MRTAAIFLALLIALKSLPAAAACVVPQAKADDKVVFLNVYDGDYLSSHSIAGQDEVTTVVGITIDKGEGNVYVVAAAGTPVIWQVRGAVTQVSSFVAIGPAARGDSKVKAGVAGLDAAKVSFAKTSDCIPVISQERDSDEARQAAASVRAMAGHNVAAAGSAVTPHFFEIDPAMKVVTGVPAAKALDFKVAIEDVGVMGFKDVPVVTPAKAEAYAVLPREAGLAQLAEQGKLIKLAEGGGEFKIVQEIPRYPAGLTGAHAARFILGKGIKPPAGDPGHSCVMSEETEQPLNARIANNCDR